MGCDLGVVVADDRDVLRSHAEVGDGGQHPDGQLVVRGEDGCRSVGAAEQGDAGGIGAALWTGARDLPAPPPESVRVWWARRGSRLTEVDE